MLTLDQLRPGEVGEIFRIEGCDGISCRLREMGFVPGEAVRFLSKAPLGDPLSCLIQGSRIALRGSEARRVFLAPPGGSTQPSLSGAASGFPEPSGRCGSGCQQMGR
ncbi:MAG: ferrous iron transport protein A [Planctomycetaceae bacterium]|nr:MAG: ferrous iron transport protein A [Planctomycetaceae bacterium]